jgi:hypothetical protein
LHAGTSQEARLDGTGREQASGADVLLGRGRNAHQEVLALVTPFRDVFHLEVGGLQVEGVDVIAVGIVAKVYKMHKVAFLAIHARNVLIRYQGTRIC